MDSTFIALEGESQTSNKGSSSQIKKILRDEEME